MKVSVTIFLFNVLIQSSPSFERKDGEPLSRFQVDLDLPPEERWVILASKYSQYAPQIKVAVADFIPEKWRPLILKIAENMEKYLPSPYAKEIVGIAKGLNISVSDAFLGNIRYELTAYCTSIVVQDDKGGIFHARNLDYDSSNLLRSLAIDVDFVKKGKILYKGTTFVGYAGLMTGRKLGAFSLSVDERDRGSFWLNLLVALTTKVKLVSFLIRDLLETAQTYKEVIGVIKKTDFAASSYIIISGVQPGEGAVVTQGRLTTIDFWSLNDTKYRWFLVETNYDHWTQPPKRDDRRDPAIKALQAIGQHDINAKGLYAVLSTYPVINQHTTYTTIMSAKAPGLYSSVFRNFTEP